MKTAAIAQTALDTKDTPFAFGVVAYNPSASPITLEGSDTSATTGFSDMVAVPATSFVNVANSGRLPRWVRAKTSGTLNLLAN